MVPRWAASNPRKKLLLTTDLLSYQSYYDPWWTDHCQPTTTTGSRIKGVEDKRRRVQDRDALRLQVRLFSLSSGFPFTSFSQPFPRVEPAMISLHKVVAVWRQSSGFRRLSGIQHSYLSPFCGSELTLIVSDVHFFHHWPNRDLTILLPQIRKQLDRHFMGRLPTCKMANDYKLLISTRTLNYTFCVHFPIQDISMRLYFPSDLLAISCKGGPEQDARKVASLVD